MLISNNVFYLAHRYLRSKHQHKSIQIMIHVCSLGILIATCALALVISIMTGFEQATYQKMQSIYPDLIIDGQGQSFDAQAMSDFFGQDHNGIQSWAPQRINQALMTYADNCDTPTMIIIHGINPDRESLVSSIETKIITPRRSTLLQLLQDDGIMIGSKLAESLNLQVGDNAYLLYSNGPQTTLNIQFQQYPVTVNGIFQTGIEDFDINLIYCNCQLFDELFPEHGITHIHVKLTEKKIEKKVQALLNDNLNASVYSWHDLYPTLLSAMKLEKWAMFLILILIVCVASMNIISLIFMYVTQKQRDIIILLCMGMKRRTIRAIFICISMCIAIPAASGGLALAWIIGTALQHYPCLKLPDNVYDTEYIPVTLELPIFCAILIITILISLLASMYATRNINRIQIVELLKTY